MNTNLISLLFIPILVIIIHLIVQYIRNKNYKPKYENNVQKPGKLERVIVTFLMFLNAFVILFAVLGMVMKETEMAIVFGCLALIFLGAILLLKRAHNTSYQENTEYFILKTGKKEYQVFYENIIDWQPSYNGIALLNKTKSDREYIKVNIKMFKPVILLRKIADMAFDGKFKDLDLIYMEIQNRKAETISYLVDHQYGYLVEDYVKQIENK